MLSFSERSRKTICREARDTEDRNDEENVQFHLEFRVLVSVSFVYDLSAEARGFDNFFGIYPFFGNNFRYLEIRVSEI